MLKPLNNHVVLEVVEVELTTASGIILSREAAKPSHSEGVILAVGEGRILDNGQRLPLDVMVGQRVIYNGFGGTKVNHQGKHLVSVSSEDILAIVE
ncbi:co-chaperone GroES [Turicibacter sanguinis]|uniref:co-chaperone GroES n=1 Tax=Turicibacter sanguinis TaxID=154288 RepID=UPI00399A48C4